MDAHSYFLTVVRDYMNVDLAMVVAMGKLSADDSEAVHALLDQMCLSSTQDPHFQQRFDKKLGDQPLLTMGHRPMFAKPLPPAPAPALFDLYTQGPKQAPRPALGESLKRQLCLTLGDAALRPFATSLSSVVFVAVARVASCC